MLSFYKLIDKSTNKSLNDYNTLEYEKDIDFKEIDFKDESNLEEDEDEQENQNNITSIEKYYGNDIIDHLIVRDELQKKFYVTKDVKDIYDMIYEDKSVPKSLHEIILPGIKQKIRYDIDMPVAEIINEHNNVFDEKVKDPFSHLFEQTDEEIIKFKQKYMYTDEERFTLGINDLFKDKSYNWAFVRAEYCVYQLLKQIMNDYPQSYIIICTSHSNVISLNDINAKYSYHIIVGAYAEHYEDIQHYAFKTYDALQHSFIKKYIDIGVYKPIQNLRITGTYKGHRCKIIKNKIPMLDNFELWKMSLITYIDAYCFKLPEQIKRIKNKYDIENKVFSNIDNLPDGYLEITRRFSSGLHIDDVVGNMVIYRRHSPGHCKICDRNHDTENSLYVIIANDRYILKCRRNKNNNKIVIPIKSEHYKGKSNISEKYLFEFDKILNPELDQEEKKQEEIKPNTLAKRKDICLVDLDKVFSN